MATLPEIARQLDALIENVAKRITLEVQSELIATTPVDTGFARSQWSISVGSPPTDVDETRSRGSASISNITGYRLRFGPIFVNNNADYVFQLNQGSSRQAPAGFVQQSIERSLGIVRRTL